MESRNDIFFEDMFLRKEAPENYSLKRMIEANSNDRHQSEDDEVKLKMSERTKMTKIFGVDF
jgi:hypothetical protein